MFGGEEYVKFTSTADAGKVYDRVEDALSGLGRVHVSDGGSIDIDARRLGNVFSLVTVDGKVRRKGADYTVTLEYTCTLNTLGWIILVIGLLLLLGGLLVLIAPFACKGKVERKVRRVLQELE